MNKILALRETQPEWFDAWCGVIAAVVVVAILPFVEFGWCWHDYWTQLVPDPQSAPTLSAAWLDIWRSGTGCAILSASGFFAAIRLSREEHAAFTFAVTVITLGLIGLAAARNVQFSATNPSLSQVIAACIVAGVALMATIPLLRVLRGPSLDRVVDRVMVGRRPIASDLEVVSNYNILIGRCGFVGGLILAVTAAAPWAT